MGLPAFSGHPARFFQCTQSAATEKLQAVIPMDGTQSVQAAFRCRRAGRARTHLRGAAGLPLNLIRGNARDGSWVGWKQGASRANLLTLRQKDHQGRLYRPELPKPFSARAESSRSSTWATAPVRTGTGIIWAIFSPAFSSTAASPRLVMSTRISPR